jgi:prophage regulatory protein
MEDQRQRSLRILREPDVRERTGLSASERKLLELRRQFPMRVPLGPRSIGWLEHEIDGWITEKMRQREDTVEAEEQRIARMPPAVRARYWREREDKPRGAAAGDLPPAVRHRRRLEREGADAG